MDWGLFFLHLSEKSISSVIVGCILYVYFSMKFVSLKHLEETYLKKIESIQVNVTKTDMEKMTSSIIKAFEEKMFYMTERFKELKESVDNLRERNELR